MARPSRRGFGGQGADRPPEGGRRLQPRRGGLQDQHRRRRGDRRADAAGTQQIWVAPTQARIHNITSSDTADDGTPEGAGAGAQAVRISGLVDWDTAEVSEDVILNGTANVATSNSYVIIHRMKIIPVGSTYNNNAGIITATAQTDGSVTAQINIGNGQTEMAIYGIPSVQTAYMTSFDVNAHNTGNPSTVVETDYDLVINERPDLNLGVFVKKANIGLKSRTYE